MATQPTFRLLDGAYLGAPGHTLLRRSVTVGAGGIKLAESTDAGSPLSLSSSDGSVGRLLLPAGMAVDAQGILYLLRSAQQRILRFDRMTGQFAQLRGVGSVGTDARCFRDAMHVAIAGNNLYVADRGNRRVQMFDVNSLALLHIWDSFDAVDVCSAAGAAFMLDQENGRVYRNVPGSADKRLVVDAPAAAGRWSRVLVDTQGQIYLLDAAQATLAVFAQSGLAAGTLTLAGDARDSFPTPAVVVDSRGLFRWEGALFDRWGRPAWSDPSAPLGKKPYCSQGVWIGCALDSEIHRCPWHRIEIDADLPAGTRLTVSTYTHNRVLTDQDVQSLTGEWATHFEIASLVDLTGNSAVSSDFLVQSDRGKYLWLKVELASDGFATPAVTRLRIHLPRETYLDHLPAIYSADEEGRRFLENFLSVFKTEWDGLEARDRDIAAYFDPKAVPVSHLDWLASWMALTLEQSWTPQQKRHLLDAAPKGHSELGTVDGLRNYLHVYLENLGGPLPAHFPVVVEGFRRRRQMVSLGKDALGRAGRGFPLWSEGVVGRLQLGQYSRVGAARMVSTGDPDTDVFQVYAHKFQLFVPASSVKTAGDERMLRRAVEAAKPGHTGFDLVLVAPRFRVGVQSSVGIDTVIGTYPQACLAGERAQTELAPSAPPASRLGYDTVLAPFHRGETMFALTRQGVRAGINTILN